MIYLQTVYLPDVCSTLTLEINMMPYHTSFFASGRTTVGSAPAVDSPSGGPVTWSALCCRKNIRQVGRPKGSLCKYYRKYSSTPQTSCVFTHYMMYRYPLWDLQENKLSKTTLRFQSIANTKQPGLLARVGDFLYPSERLLSRSSIPSS